MTPQIDRLGKMSTVLGVSTHIYWVCKEIDGKTFIFKVNLGMWPLKSIVLGKMSTVLRVSTHIYGVSKEINGKMFICRVNLGMWHVKLIVLEKWPKTCTLNLQLLHNTKRTTKWSGHMMMIDTPRELLHMKDLLPERVTI